MANCSVLEYFQKPTDKPTKRIKRSEGQTQVRRGVAHWLVKNILLQLLPPHVQGEKHVAKSEYVPFGLPPNIDAMLGVIDQSPVLSEQIRFRHI